MGEMIKKIVLYFSTLYCSADRVILQNNYAIVEVTDL